MVKSHHADWAEHRERWRAKTRRAPSAENLVDHIAKAAAQFDGVNCDRKLPNILVLVGHARLRGPPDLQMAIEGVPMPEGRPAFLLVDDQKQHSIWEKQRNLRDAAQRLNLVVRHRLARGISAWPRRTSPREKFLFGAASSIFFPRGIESREVGRLSA